MDLTRLDTWPREELEREARRIGIWAPQRLSRRALIARLRAHHGTPVRRARRLLGKLVGVAREIATGSPRLRLGLPPSPQAPQRHGAHGPTKAEPPQPGATSPATSEAPSPSDDNEACSASGSPQAAPTHDEPTQATPAHDAPSHDAPTHDAPTHGEPTQAAPTHDAPTHDESAHDAPTHDAPTQAQTAPAQDAPTHDEPAHQAQAADDSAPAGDPKLDALLAKEPIQTRTMARILASQGHTRRALAIYQKLVQQRPDDKALRTEADAVRSGKPPKKAHAADDDDESDRDECVSVLMEHAETTQAIVAWHVRSAAVTAARKLSTENAPLVLRTIVLQPVGDTVQRNVSERPVEREGELAVAVPGGARLIAAVGLRAGERFISIAHAPTLGT